LIKGCAITVESSCPRSARHANEAHFDPRQGHHPSGVRGGLWARRGLALDGEELDPDTHTLLLRQLFLAHFEARRFSEAVSIASQMAAVGAMQEVAYADLARAHQALDDLPSAIDAQRKAARAAHPSRRSFHYWCLATLEHFDGDVPAARKTLARALRWAHADRALLEAHDAYIALSAGIAVDDLEVKISALGKSRAREGYGQWLLGMIAHEMGDSRRAAVHLRTFLRRLASADPAKAFTLREEMRRARSILAQIDDQLT
jgi:tetratricopeptide (TPR) repeat protein